ncbi:glucosamine 6-phosphate N-acetyltransferase [Saitoella complicata NRRL Y-17804]|nr:glucosamine 6-phosphate N-acetyltransferase [Saitoella complicata NRRL Y-17804]ODQ56281.1 glucosamine 6-phosphate N-acetyltransferase [Saitoella complicata NRRL Y-17804]
MSEEYLFSPDLISPNVKANLPKGYTCRPLSNKDYGRGFLDVLKVLTTVGDISEKMYLARFNWMKARNDSYYLLVIVDQNDRIVGSGTLLIERKFIHETASTGHIEDIAVAKDQQGKKLGLRIIEALDYVCEKQGAYKNTLVCKDHNIPFYEKCGFKRGQNEMTRYYKL